MSRKKKTIEEVKSAFSQRGFTLLSTEYISINTHLEYLCDQGHISKIGFGSLQGGHGCSKCSGNKKKTISEVRLAFNQRGYTLLSTEYLDSKSPLQYICSRGHQTKISFNKLQSERSCGFCSDKKKTINEVRLAFTQRGYTLLSTEYNSNKSPLFYICNQGHNAKISFANFQNGSGCLECSGKRKKTFEEVRKLFSSRNYQLLSTEYKNALSPLNYICGDGHKNKINVNNLTTGQGCPECAERGFNPNKPATLYYIRFQFEGNFYYKIGITNNSAFKRFQGEKTPYIIVKETYYNLGRDAYEQEQVILKEFAKFRYKGEPFLVNGNTELFTKDVLYIDDSILGKIAS